jgi:hypothetical protein
MALSGFSLEVTTLLMAIVIELEKTQYFHTTLLIPNSDDSIRFSIVFVLELLNF